MNRSRKNILPLVIFFLFAGCSASKQKKKQNPDNSHGSAANIIDAVYAHTDTLHIPVGKRRPVKMSKLFSSIHYLPLQSQKGKLIGRIRKIVFTDGKIFIFDRSRPAVFIYGSDGHFINMISIPKGGGPKELIRPLDMVVDSSQKQISVLGAERINTYNYTGKDVKDLRLQTIPHKFALLPNDEFVLYMDNYLYSGNSYGNPGYNLLFINKDGKLEKEALPIPKKWAMLGILTNVFPSYRGQLLFAGAPDQHVYKITTDSVIALFYLDFGKYNVPESMYQSRTNFTGQVQFQKKIAKKGYVSSVHNLVVTDRMIKFDIVYDIPKPTFQIFYSKHTGKVFVATKLINNMDYGPAIPFWFHKGNQLVMFVQPSDLIKKAKAIKKELTPEQLKQYRQRPQNLIDLTQNMTPMDNPVLMFCKVKSTF
jgi:hypothetical protein